MYALLRKLLFLLPPEDAHYFSMYLLQRGVSVGFIRSLIKKSFTYTHPSLEKELWGLPFKNPVGLAAGFDKNARWLTELECLGFGFVEIGTVTPQPQPGNDAPRLFRLPTDKALINRMGFNNYGVKAIRGRLEHWRLQQPNTSLIVGGNIGKNKVTENEDAWKDYEICFKELHHTVDYFVVNVSSPNTPGLRALQEKEVLAKILQHLQHINAGMDEPKPILLKIAPDLNTAQLDDIVLLATDLNLDGIIATNTTISREGLQTPSDKVKTIGAGGLSGKPLQATSTHILQYLHKQLGNRVPIVANGGIFTAADAKEKIESGASLVQVWTGFIYEGPGIAGNICRGLMG